MKRATPIGCAAVMGAMGLFGGSALADMTLINQKLVDQNSSITIDPDATNGGILSWIVDSKEYLQRHWFWYRAGNMAQAAPITSLAPSSYNVSDINGDGNVDTISIAYHSSDPAAPFTAYIWLSLTGSDPGGGSSIQQIISINNDDPHHALSMQFYQYMDMKLAPVGGTETATFSVDAPGAPVNTLMQTASDGSVVHSATVVSPPGGWDVGSSTTILNKLGATSVNPSVASVIGQSFSPFTGPDVAWVWGWDLNIGVNDSASIVMSEDVTPSTSVPMPSSVWMGGAMLVVLGGTAVRRQRRND